MVNDLPAWLPEHMAKALGIERPNLVDVRPLPGHSGVGYSFRPAAAIPGLPDKMVVRLAPENVAPTGPADVVRQARIMASLAAEHIPVPAMLCCGHGPEVTGKRAFFVASFVDGRQIGKAAVPSDADRVLARRGVEALADMHDADWRRHVDAWGAVVTIPMELDRLDKLFHRPTIDPRSGGRIGDLADRLRMSPPVGDCGFVHGDYHWGNVIFGEAKVRAIVDWEIAMLGPRLIDIGWLAFYADPESFLSGEQSPLSGMVLGPEEMIDAYRGRRKQIVTDREIAWYRAFAAYRYGVITCFNEMLHRRGKRHDPMWQSVIKSVPRMAERGLEVLSGVA